MKWGNRALMKLRLTYIYEHEFVKYPDLLLISMSMITTALVTYLTPDYLDRTNGNRIISKELYKQ